MSAELQRIDFNRPLIVGREMDHVRAAVAAMHTSGDGPFTAKVAELLRRELGVRGVLLTPSCTDALEMAGLLLDLEPGDEVIVPAFAFVSTANAFALRGARPVFADVRPDTLNLDEQSVETLVGERTRAIVPLHYAGVGCEMETLTAIAERHRLAVVEDNAHGLFGRYRDRPLGTFGGLGTLSFHETKNFSCGEGGALLVNEVSFVERAEMIRDKGTDRQKLFRGQVDKYTWVDLGSSFVLSDLLAAFLYGQLEQRKKILAERERIWLRYDRGLRGRVERFGVQLPGVPAECRQAHHMYYLLLDSLDTRQRLIAELDAKGIAAVFHYTPLHLSKMGRSFGGRAGQCPVTERVSDTLLRLPFHLALTEQDQDRVVSAVLEFLERA